MASKTGVVIMTYGSASTAEHVREYFEHIYPGRSLDTLIADFENRYRLVGSSPLIRITQEQAALLQEKLGNDYFVRAGMRHSAPFIRDMIRECADAGAQRMVGIVLSPQFSSFIMEGYVKDFSAATEEAGITNAKVAGPWPAEEHFIQLLAKRAKDALTRLGADTPVVFTTHSLPQRVVDKDPSYLGQLQQTIDSVRKLLPESMEWYQGYQSAGHTPEAWLKPDLTDILADLKAKGHEKVLIVPIQFLADHLEILYDLDIAGKEQCEAADIEYNRIQLPNTEALFISALASIALKT